MAVKVDTQLNLYKERVKDIDSALVAIEENRGG